MEKYPVAQYLIKFPNPTVEWSKYSILLHKKSDRDMGYYNFTSLPFLA